MRLRPRGAAAYLSVIRTAGQCFSRPSMSAFFYAHARQQKSAAFRRRACGARPGGKASPARWKARTPAEISRHSAAGVRRAARRESISCPMEGTHASRNQPPFGGRRAARGQERKHLLPDGRHARQQKSAAIRRQACGARPGEKASPVRWKARTPAEISRHSAAGVRRAARRKGVSCPMEGTHARGNQPPFGGRRAARGQEERHLLSDGRHACQQKSAAIRRQACNYFMEGVPQDGAQKRFRGGYYGSI